MIWNNTIWINLFCQTDFRCRKFWCECFQKDHQFILICCELFTIVPLALLHISHWYNPHILPMYSMHNNLTSTNINCETFIITSNIHTILSYTLGWLCCCFVPNLFQFFFYRIGITVFKNIYIILTIYVVQLRSEWNNKILQLFFKNDFIILDHSYISRGRLMELDIFCLFSSSPKCLFEEIVNTLTVEKFWTVYVRGSELVHPSANIFTHFTQYNWALIISFCFLGEIRSLCSWKLISMIRGKISFRLSDQKAIFQRPWGCKNCCTLILRISFFLSTEIPPDPFPLPIHHCILSEAPIPQPFIHSFNFSQIGTV